MVAPNRETAIGRGGLQARVAYFFPPRKKRRASARARKSRRGCCGGRNLKASGNKLKFLLSRRRLAPQVLRVHYQ